ncbi:CapA family protein [Patescibacteria group bacterium]|nr:CapA family protein [Patescibacteria group bacterium]
MRTYILIGVAVIALGVSAVPLFGSSPVPTHPVARILFGGDVMFDRYIRTMSDARGADYPLSCIRETLVPYDLVVANLEGPITSFESVSVGTSVGAPDNTRFTFPPRTATVLQSSGIDVVHLGNNHILDFGPDGLMETKNALSASGVAYFGDPDRREEERILERTVHGVPITFVSWSDWAVQSVEETERALRAAREANRVPIVFAHWGDEYVGAPERVRELARRFVDQGAKLVVGSHSHVEGEYEEYRGVPIYYSLGNFVFDQYFSEEVRNGILLSAEVTPEGVMRVERIPIRLERDGRTCLR